MAQSIEELIEQVDTQKRGAMSTIEELVLANQQVAPDTSPQRKELAVDRMFALEMSSSPEADPFALLDKVTNYVNNADDFVAATNIWVEQRARETSLRSVATAIEEGDLENLPSTVDYVAQADRTVSQDVSPLGKMGSLTMQEESLKAATLSAELKESGLSVSKKDRVVRNELFALIAAKDDPGEGAWNWIKGKGASFKEAVTYVAVPLRFSDSIGALPSVTAKGFRPFMPANLSVMRGWADYKAAAAEWWQMPPEQRILYADGLVNAISEATRDNWLGRLALLEPFLYRDSFFWPKVDLTTDAIDATIITTIVTRPLRLAVALRRSSSARMLALEAAGADLKGRYIVTNLDNPAKAASLGIDLADSAFEAVPGVKPMLFPRAPADEFASTSYGTILEKWMDSVETRVKEIREWLGEISWETDVFINRELATKAQKTALDLAAKRPGVINARVLSEDNVGFVIETTLEPRTAKGLSLSEVRTRLSSAEKNREAATERLKALDESAGYTGGVSRGYGQLETEKNFLKAEIAGWNAQIKRLKGDEKKLASLPSTSASTERVRYTREAQGEFASTDLSGIESVSSKRVQLDKVDTDLVPTSTLGDFAVGATREILIRAWAVANRGVSRAKIPGVGKSRMEMLEMVEEAGDEANRLFSIADLRSGVSYRGAVIKLKPHEVEAYFLRRALMDKFHGMKNAMVRGNLDFDGYKLLVVKNLGNLFARPLKHGDGRIPGSVTRVLDEATGEVVDVTSSMRKTTGAGKPKQIVRLHKRADIGNESVNYALVTRRSLRELPQQVLNHRRSYVPKIRRGVHYVVTRHKQRTVDGGLVSALDDKGDIVRFFDNKADAEAWAIVRQAEKKDGTYLTKSSHEMGQTSTSYWDDLDTNGYGGLYQDTRTDTIIYKGWNNEIPERLTSNEAFEAYLNHLSLRYPMNQWRMNIISKYLNTYGDALQDANDWLSPIVKQKGVSDDFVHSADVVRRNMMDMLYIPTTQERAFERNTRHMAEWLSKRFSGKSSAAKSAAASLHNLQHKDPIAAMRALAFHALLGWFSPAQLFIQASGMYMAIAIDPLRAPKYASRYMALRAVMYTNNETAWRTTAEVARLTGMNPDEFVAMVRAFRSTGLHYSVRSTADYASSVANLPLSSRGVSALANAALLPYREGELIVRGYAWQMAADHIMKARGIKSWLKVTKADITDITKEHLRFTMNMHRANRNVGWQTNFLSLPLQFAQIWVRFAENMVGPLFGMKSEWTRKQRMSILAATPVLFGAAGIPWGQQTLGAIKDWAVKNHASRNENEQGTNFWTSFFTEDADSLRKYQQGLVGFVTEEFTGAQSSVSARVSIPGAVEDWVETILSMDSKFWPVVTGAFGGTGTRVYVHGSKAINMIWKEPTNPHTWYKAALEAAKVLSVYNNIDKANFWWYHQAYYIRTPDGDVKGKLRDLDPTEDRPTIIAQALGFSPTELRSYTEWKEWDKKESAEVADRVKAMRQYFFDHRPREGFSTDEEEARFGEVMYSLTADMTEDGRREVMENFGNSLSRIDYNLWLEAAEKTLKNTGRWTFPETTRGTSTVVLNPATTPDTTR